MSARSIGVSRRFAAIISVMFAAFALQFAFASIAWADDDTARFTTEVENSMVAIQGNADQAVVDEGAAVLEAEDAVEDEAAVALERSYTTQTVYNKKAQEPTIYDEYGYAMDESQYFIYGWEDASGNALSGAPVNAGTYYFYLYFYDTGISYYEPYTITRAPLAKMGLDHATFYYNGARKAPAVSIKAKDGDGNAFYVMKASKKSNAGAKLTYSAGRVKPGTYKVVATGRGNYKGTLTKYFKIKIRPTAFKSDSYGYMNSYVVLKWTRRAASQVDGYQIAYSKSSDFSGYKLKTVRGASKYYVKFTPYSSWSYVYLKVRTYKKVGTKVYYSAWSKAGYI